MIDVIMYLSLRRAGKLIEFLEKIARLKFPFC